MNETLRQAMERMCVERGLFDNQAKAAVDAYFASADDDLKRREHDAARDYPKQSGCVVTKEQFVQCAAWWHEDRLLIDGLPCIGMPPRTDDFNRYSRRPDAPPMSDEVWVTPETPESAMAVYCDRFKDCMTRYVRADAIIDGLKLEGRHKDDPPGKWSSLSCCEYRFKP